MNIVLRKGFEFNAEYASTDFPVLDANWAGSVSLYVTYPGTPTLTKPLVRVGNKMTLSLSISEIQNLPAGVYSFVSTITNSVVGVTATSLGYATVTNVPVFTVPMCKLYMTVAKTDGTPAGSQTSNLANTATGTQVVLGWKGVQLTVNNTVADLISGSIVGTETVTTTSNAAGYAEIYVVKGLTVSVSCPVFGKTVSINTTGLDSVDISTFF